MSKVEGQPKIRFYTIGSVCDYRDTVDLWQEKLDDGYICHERISQEEAHNAMLDCDVLVSMGHDSANMCPSKAIDFAAALRQYNRYGLYLYTGKSRIGQIATSHDRAYLLEPIIGTMSKVLFCVKRFFEI